MLKPFGVIVHLSSFEGFFYRRNSIQYAYDFFYDG